MVEEKAELRSGITAPFNKRLNEALQFNPQMPFNIGNTVTPSQLIGVLKGEQGTPGLPAAISAIKDDNNLVALATSDIERGSIEIKYGTVTISSATNFYVDFIIPKGKKYKLKASNMYTLGGTVTIGNCQVIIASLTDTNAQAPVMNVSSGSLTAQSTTDLVVDDRYKISCRFTCTAHTADSVGTARIIVQEITI